MLDDGGRPLRPPRSVYEGNAGMLFSDMVFSTIHCLGGPIGTLGFLHRIPSRFELEMRHFAYLSGGQFEYSLLKSDIRLGPATEF